MVGQQDYDIMSAAGYLIFYEWRTGQYGQYVAKHFPLWPSRQSSRMLSGSARKLTAFGTDDEAIIAVFTECIVPDLAARQMAPVAPAEARDTLAPAAEAGLEALEGAALAHNPELGPEPDSSGPDE